MATPWDTDHKSAAASYSYKYTAEWDRLWGKDGPFTKSLHKLFPDYIFVQVYNLQRAFYSPNIYIVFSLKLFCYNRIAAISKLKSSSVITSVPGGVKLLDEIMVYYNDVLEHIEGLMPTLSRTARNNLLALSELFALSRVYEYLLTPEYSIKMDRSGDAYDTLRDLIAYFGDCYSPKNFIAVVERIDKALTFFDDNPAEFTPDAVAAIQVMKEAYNDATRVYSKKIEVAATAAARSKDLTAVSKALSESKAKKEAPPTAVSKDWEKILSDQIGVPVKIVPAPPGSETSFTHFDKATGTYIINMLPKDEVAAIGTLIHEQGHIRVTFQKEMKRIADIYGPKMINIADDLRINMYYSERNVGFREGMKSFFLSVKPSGDPDSLPVKSWHLFYIATQFGEGANPEEAVILDMARTLGVKLPAEFTISYDTYVKAISLYFFGKEDEQSRLRKRLYEVLYELMRKVDNVDLSRIHDGLLKADLAEEAIRISDKLTLLLGGDLKYVTRELPAFIERVKAFIDKYNKGAA